MPITLAVIIQGYLRSSVVVPSDAAYMTCY